MRESAKEKDAGVSKREGKEGEGTLLWRVLGINKFNSTWEDEQCRDRY